MYYNCCLFNCLKIFISDNTSNDSFNKNKIKNSSRSTKVDSKKKKSRDNKREIAFGSVNYLIIILYELINNDFRRR